MSKTQIKVGTPSHGFAINLHGEDGFTIAVSSGLLYGFATNIAVLHNPYRDRMESMVKQDSLLSMVKQDSLLSMVKQYSLLVSGIILVILLFPSCTNVAVVVIMNGTSPHLLVHGSRP